MPSDPTKPLLRLIPQAERPRQKGAQRPVPRPAPFPTARQIDTFGPKFNRLTEVLARDRTGLELRTDPTALAPERLLVFEVRGAISPFVAAVQRVPGLELIDEEEMAADDDDKEPVAYLMVPDLRALQDLESLWRRWQSGRLVRGETPWRDVFASLRNLRPWGPTDRVQSVDSELLALEIEERDENEPVRLEVELVYRESEDAAQLREEEVNTVIVARGGRTVSRARLSNIGYHALLVDLPVWAVRQIIECSIDGIAGLEPVMYIRPQSVATTIEIGDQSAPSGHVETGPLGEPILALLDGVPVAAHALLERHLVVDDQFDLEPTASVDQRKHGTAMASLIIHGDRNRAERPLPRQIHIVPVMGNRDEFPADRLVVDLIYQAIVMMRDDNEPTAPGVLIVNISLGNQYRPFHGQLSPWARLLDRLAYRFGILFLVSAGNNCDSFSVPDFATRIAFEDADASSRASAIVRALGNIVADRRLFAPAETVNGVTVGACNDDAVTPAARVAARVNIDPFPEVRTSNPSSTLGPGFARSVKPDILMPGAREHLRVVRNDPQIEVEPAGPSRSAGLKVAAPPHDGLENVDGFTNGTSAATALAARTCHRIHDALEAAYGEAFTVLPHHQRAVLLKALLVHPAEWSEDAASLIRATLGPPDGRQHVRQKDNIRRFLGFGCVDAEDAVACAEDRATFWATGILSRDTVANVAVPIPTVISGHARPHALSATLAWFTPVSPGRKSYRSARLKLLEPTELAALTVSAHGNQPDSNQTNRGTLFTRCWRGDRAPTVGPDMTIDLIVQRDPDQGAIVDDPIPFGLAVTLAMPGMVELYEQVRQRLRPVARARAR